MRRDSSGSLRDLPGARESNAGDEFHVLWGVSLCLKMIQPASTLKRVVIEDVDPLDRTGSPNRAFLAADITEYYGGLHFGDRSTHQTLRPHVTATSALHTSRRSTPSTSDPTGASGRTGRCRWDYRSCIRVTTLGSYAPPVMNPTRQRRADQTLILLALSPKQRKRAHEANPGLGSVPAYVVLCGQYGQLFGSASQCRSLYEWWRNQYLDALFASAFESASFPVDGYRSTPDLDAVLARAAAGADSQSDLGYIGLVDPEPDVAERRVPEAEVPLTPEASYQLTPRQARQRAKYQEREGRRLERLRGNTGRKRRSVKTWLLVTVVLVGGLIIIGSLGEDDNDTTVRSTTRPTTSATATRPTAPSGAVLVRPRRAPRGRANPAGATNGAARRPDRRLAER